MGKIRTGYSLWHEIKISSRCFCIIFSAEKFVWKIVLLIEMPIKMVFLSEVQFFFWKVRCSDLPCVCLSPNSSQFCFNYSNLACLGVNPNTKQLFKKLSGTLPMSETQKSTKKYLNVVNIWVFLNQYQVLNR